MSTIHDIEKAIESLPLADQLRLYRDLPHLIGREPEDLEWQRLAIEEFFRDDSPDDAAYDGFFGAGEVVSAQAFDGSTPESRLDRCQAGSSLDRSSPGG